jgi:hypothetical protein
MTPLRGRPVHYSASPLYRFSTLPLLHFVDGRTDGRMDANDTICLCVANDFVQAEKRTSSPLLRFSTFPLLHFSASPLFHFSASPLRGWTDGRMDAKSSAPLRGKLCSDSAGALDYVVRRDTVKRTSSASPGLCPGGADAKSDEWMQMQRTRKQRRVQTDKGRLLHSNDASVEVNADVEHRGKGL